ncbi:phosphate ABC transporter substrate-binding protein PstS [Streptomyces sp. P9(2023)]|uniref:phosphate ABC transporter substrate-binding protein PstS n=1 Tax=Streptomyces sp. P9(2023) TaxID=3064394 RepID=UPI0028F42C82|nr:phosphate ABC transporter substrate-binding protein PstS [Streptomyces sp. P9(2023)]MDT9691472.1 phosphate ABC transporter substrate-binding protein PstS [Streptomyces sp. P9(2023)]
MSGRPPAFPARVLRRSLAVLVTALALVVPGALPAAAESYVPVSGAGSTWSQNALDQWRANVKQYGMTVNYNGTGSSDGRNQFRNGTVDFAVSEIPYGINDSGVADPPPSRKFSYMPIVAGGTAFMYNLKIGNRRVTNLRLSGENVAKIFTGAVTMWNDPAIKADNPGLAAGLPARRIVPVVRSDGSGTTAQLTTWLSKKHAGLWDAYCGKAGRRTPCGPTSNFPVIGGKGFVGQSGSNGVSGYVAQEGNQGTITYVEYSYAVSTTGFPVAKILNEKGYYTEPTAQNVAVSLTRAGINPDLTQRLDEVYNSTDPRTYQLSSYSYMIVPTALESNFNPQKGKSLGAFAYYFLCQGQQSVDRLGYSPLPINLVQAGLAQVKRIPGGAAETIDIRKCKNPTFSSDGTNTLAKTAPNPPACDFKGATQCDTGTGGNKTPTKTGGSSGGGSGGTGGGSGGATGGGTGGTASGGGATGAATGEATGGASGGTAGAGGAAGATGGSGAATGGALDPDTGQPIAAGDAGGSGGGGGDLYGVPVTTAAGLGGGLRTALMVLGAALFFGITVGPPLLHRRLAARRAGEAGR